MNSEAMTTPPTAAVMGAITRARLEIAEALDLDDLKLAQKVALTLERDATTEEEVQEAQTIQNVILRRALELEARLLQENTAARAKLELPPAEFSPDGHMLNPITREQVEAASSNFSLARGCLTWSVIFGVGAAIVRAVAS